ncbi:MAG: hypothetical protein IJN42_04145 [Clostridia bacterium]|nr:hypothetical protein [Clostridia bacterium]
MYNAIEWTYLPWDVQGMAGKVCWPCVMVGVIFVLITQIIRRTRLGYEIHHAPFLSMEVTGLALVINTAVYSLFFWYVALPVSLFFTTILCISARGIQNKIYSEEKDGAWGLHPSLRQVRGEMFSDLSVEEQLEYKKKVESSFRKLSPWWYYPLTVLVPFGVMLLLKLCGLPYIFVPHAL